MLRNIWTSGLLLFAAIMGSTFFITTVWQATVAIALVGICWAIACWVPFAIIMEFLKEADDSASKSRSATASGRPPLSRVASTPYTVSRSQPSTPIRPTERTPLTRSWSTADIGGAADDIEYTGSGPVAGGTIMGIHNLAIVFPQFLVGAIPPSTDPVLIHITDRNCRFFDLQMGRWCRECFSFEGRRGRISSKKWSRLGATVRRSHGFGELTDLEIVLTSQIGALISRKVPPTKTEKVGQDDISLS